MPILAIDLGTTNVKVAVVRRDGALLGTGQNHIPTMHVEDGGAEQDAELVWESVLDAAEQALSSLDDRREVRGIACASQYSSIVPVDAEGRPTANMVVWMDKRGMPVRLEKIAGGERIKPSPYQMLRWVQIHGIPPLDSGADSLAHMRFIKHGWPEVYARTAKFLEPMDYVGMRMSGRAVTNRCSGFMLLLADNRMPEPQYHPTLLKWSGIDREKLPELVPVDEPLGPIQPEVADRLGLSQETVVFTFLNHTQDGGVGDTPFAGSHAGISVGTSCVCITLVVFR